jgi:apolipoprotein N-acyltransferase
MKSLRLLVPALLSGVMLAMAWLGSSGLILLIALIPLLYVEEIILQNQRLFRPIVFWSVSLLTFLCWNILSTWWIFNATPAGAIFAIIINSFLMSLVWLLSHVVTRKKGYLFGHIFLFFAWISFEYLHYNWDMSWPWLTLGNGLANDIKLIQWVEYTGVFGGTAWILAINLLLFHFLKGLADESLRRLLSRLSIVLIVIIFPISFSLIRYSSYSEKYDPVEVVIAQPNIDPYHEKFGSMSHMEQLSRLLHVSGSMGDAPVNFFVGPETALHAVWENNSIVNDQVEGILNFLRQKYPDAGYLVGATTFRRYSSGDPITATARYSADSTVIYDAYNAACFIAIDQPVQYYHKTKLVSGVEKMPFEKQLAFLKNLVIDLGGITGTLGTQNDTVVFRHGKAVVAAPVCYESGYGEYLTRFIKKGANIFFVITNDGWWKNTPGYRQHLSYSRLRAIELRRSIARSANTGISCFINQRGDILQKTSWWTAATIAGKMNLNEKVTYYARHGDYIAQLSVLIFSMLLCVYIVDIVLIRLKCNSSEKSKKEPH